MHSGPAVVDGTVYIGENNVYALTGGNRQWRGVLPVALGLGFVGVGTGGVLWWAGHSGDGQGGGENG